MLMVMVCAIRRRFVAVLAVYAVVGTFHVAAGQEVERFECACIESCGAGAVDAGSPIENLRSPKDPDLILCARDNVPTACELYWDRPPAIRHERVSTVQDAIARIKDRETFLGRPINVVVHGHGGSGAQCFGKGNECIGINPPENDNMLKFTGALIGKIERLYLVGCAVAADPHGPLFLSALSKALGGVPVKGFTESTFTHFSTQEVDGQACAGPRDNTCPGADEICAETAPESGIFQCVLVTRGDGYTTPGVKRDVTSPEQGACCDGTTGTCIPSLEEVECAGDQRRWFVHRLCADILSSGECQQHRGACCDMSQPDGECRSNVLPGDCDTSNPQIRWYKNLLCLEDGGPVDCLEHTGACCDQRIADPALRCEDDISESLCPIDDPRQVQWYKDTACADIDCPEHTGACCDEDTFGGCEDNVPASLCNCKKCVFYKDTLCNQIVCLHKSIPTVSDWGLVVMTLLLLTGAKIYFGRRRSDVPSA